MNKNKAVIDFLLTCPAIAENPFFFNFGNANAENNQFVTNATDISINTPFIDGSVRKRYTFTLIFYKAVAYRALVENKSDENMEYVVDIQDILDWINEQGEAHVYPNFGNKCIIDTMQALTNEPNLNSVDKSSTPALAKYSISIKIEYIDTSKAIWNVEGD